MLTDDEIDRYARHLVLKEIGGAGQMKLKAAKVALVVPKRLHGRYPKVCGVDLLDVEGFVSRVQRALSN